MVWQSCFGQSRPLTSFKASGVFKSSLVNKAFVGNKGLRPKPLVSAGPGSQCSCPGWGGGERRQSPFPPSGSGAEGQESGAREAALWELRP